MDLREPTPAKKPVRIPLSIEENALLTEEVLRRRQNPEKRKGKGAMGAVPALVNEYVEKGILEMQNEMDENNRIILTIEQPIITDENYFAYIYLRNDLFVKLKNLADFTGLNAMRLAKYLMIKELAKLQKGE